MKRLASVVFSVVFGVAFALPAFAHCGGHGPAPVTKPSAADTRVTTVVLAADAERGSAAPAQFEAELAPFKGAGAFTLTLLKKDLPAPPKDAKAMVLYFFGGCESKDYVKELVTDDATETISIKGPPRTANADRVEIIFTRGETKYVAQYVLKSK